jgi:kinesin family protein C2/C3
MSKQLSSSGRPQSGGQGAHRASTAGIPQQIVEVLHNYQPLERHQLTLLQGEKLTVLEKDPTGWWIGKNSRGAVGIFPSTYVRDLNTAPPPLEVTKEIVVARLVSELQLQSAQPGLASSSLFSPQASTAGSPTFGSGGQDDDLFALSEDELLREVRRESQRRDRLADEAQGLVAAIVDTLVQPLEGSGDGAPEVDQAQKRQQLTIVQKRKADVTNSENRLLDEVEDLLYELKSNGIAVPSLIPTSGRLLSGPPAGQGSSGSPKLAAPSSPSKVKQAPPKPKQLQSRPAWLSEVTDEKAVHYLLQLENDFKTLNEELDGMESALEALAKSCKKAEEKASANKESAPATGPASSSSEEKLLQDLENKLSEITEESKRMKRTIKDRMDAHQKECLAMEEEARSLDQEVESGKKQYLEMQQALESLTATAQASLQEVQQQKEALARELAEAADLAKEAASYRAQLPDKLAAKKKLIAEKTTAYRTLERERRVIYNDIQELKGNLRVYCRIKPCIGGEVNEHVKEIDDMTLKVFDETTLRESTYEFDLVLGEKTTQVSIFEEVRPLATSVLDGYNVCIFAYGQTGSGKTYTMEGPPNNRGVNYRTVTELFAIAKERGSDYKVTISVSVVEVYNNVAYDLQSNRTPIKVRFGGDQGVVCEPLVKTPVQSADDVQRVLDGAYAKRQVAGTSCNEHSSRSHCILTVYVDAQNLSSRSEIKGKLHLIDLAGSERVKNSKVEGDRLKEATHINTSLTHLKTVIQALASKKGHVSYRNSTLTSILQDSLGGNCKCLMFANISPLTPNIPETICTLKYAAEARKVEVGKATANVNASPTSAASPVSPSSASLMSGEDMDG